MKSRCDQIVLFLEGPWKGSPIYSFVAGQDCNNFGGGLDSLQAYKSRNRRVGEVHWDLEYL